MTETGASKGFRSCLSIIIGLVFLGVVFINRGYINRWLYYSFSEGCDSFEVFAPRAGKPVTDKDGNKYEVRILYDGKGWIASNLRLKQDSAWSYQDNENFSKTYGLLYSFDAAQKGCESLGKGWRLPTAGDWEKMLNQYGGAEPAWQYPKTLLDNISFMLEFISKDHFGTQGMSSFKKLYHCSKFFSLGGSRSRMNPGDPVEYRGMGSYTHYWGGTKEEPTSIAFDNEFKRIKNAPAISADHWKDITQLNAYSVRCVCEKSAN